MLPGVVRVGAIRQFVQNRLPKDRKFNAPKVSIAALFAPCQTRKTGKFPRKSHSPRRNHHLPSRDKPQPLSFFVPTIRYGEESVFCSTAL